MNTNSNAITVLCYGDSNTYGQKPDKQGRFAAHERWTGVLQNILGDDYYIIEEGLSSRTTDLDYSAKAGRNGRTYFEPCLQSHDPLHVVLIMLGTNDVKIEFNRPARDIAHALRGYITDVKSHALAATERSIRIVLISPAPIRSNEPHFAEFYTGKYDEHSAEKSVELASEIAQVALEEQVEFVDAGQFVQVGDDGIHLSLEAHAKLGSALADVIAGKA